MRDRGKRQAFGESLIAQLNEAITRLDDAERAELDFDRVAHDVLDVGLKTSSTRLTDALYENAPSMLADYRRIDARWRRDIWRQWGGAIDLYRMLWVACHEIASTVHDEHRPGTPECTALVHALVGVHARASRIALEVQVLIENGLGQGALARARTLHELAVISCTLTAPRRHDARQELARRYLDHQAVGTYLDALAYQKTAERIGYEPFDDAAVAEMKQERDQLEERYGKEYCKPNGWACDLNDGKAPRFVDLERIAGLDHLRSFYNWASHEVHADAVAWRQNTSSWQGAPYFISGRAPHGLADPGHMAAISLLNVTVALMNNQAGGPDAETLVTMHTLLRLCDDVGDRFLEAHRIVEARRQESGTQADQ